MRYIKPGYGAVVFEFDIWLVCLNTMDLIYYNLFNLEPGCEKSPGELII